jgi:hypothetical protein
MKRKKTVIFGGMILIIAVCAIGLFTQSPKWSQRSFEASDSRKNLFPLTTYLNIKTEQLAARSESMKKSPDTPRFDAISN